MSQSLTINDNPLQVFTNDNLHIHIRAFRDENGIVWFVARDVAIALGYSVPQKAILDHCKGVPKWNTLQTAGGPQKLRVITEGDVLRLVANSKLPNAQRIESWMFDTVIPQVINKGFYGTPKFMAEIMSDPRKIGQLFFQLADEQDKRKKAEKQIEADKPFKDFGKALSVSKTNLLVSEFAKILRQNGYETGPNRLFKQWLQEKVIYRRLLEPGRYCYWPYEHCLEAEWFKMKAYTYADGKGSHTTYTITVTPKGQRHFLNKYLKNMPVMIENEATK